MSTQTLTLGHATHATTAGNAGSRVRDWLSALGARFIAAQQARADRIVRPYLARTSETTLRELGFTTEEIAAIKRDRHLPVVRWV